MSSFIPFPVPPGDSDTPFIRSSFDFQAGQEIKVRTIGTAAGADALIVTSDAVEIQSS